ncbi:MAG: YCF48-related protein [Vicingaceae bacterium]
MRLILLLLCFVFACQNSKIDKHSTDVKIEEQNSPTNESIRGISVIDSNVVWLSGSGGTILQTENGGKEWKLIPAPDQDSLDFRDIHAFSAQEAIVVSAGFPARVYRTEDAGKHWNLVYENKDSSAFMNSIHFRNHEQGIIFGDQLSGCHLVLQTLNKGKSWKRISCENLPKPLKVENGFAASGSCITSTSKGKYIIGLGGEKSRVFTSPKGNVWQANVTTLGGGSQSRGIYSIASGSGLVIALGGDYTKVDSTYSVSISKNQGKSWTKGGEVSGYRSAIDYSPLLDAWLAVGSNGVDLSEDGGQYWEKAAELDLNTIQFDHFSKYAWAAGSDGSLYKLSIKIP